MTPYLLVASDFNRRGGMERANYALALHLARRGVELHLVAHSVAPDLAGMPNVHAHRVAQPAGSYFLGSFLVLRTGRQWAKKIAARGGRVLVNGGNCIWPAANWVHYVHSAYESQVSSNVGVLRRIKRRVAHGLWVRDELRAFRIAKVLIANSERTRKDLARYCQVDDSRIKTVYLSADMENFCPATPERRQELRRQFGWDAQRPIVVFIGAMGDRRKGFDTLFEAWKMLCGKPSWDADLAVVGTGAEVPAWQALTAQAGLTSRIHFMGYRKDVPDILKAADILVAPTRYEAYGLGVHEALCCGLPAIVSVDAGVAERYPPELAPLLLPDPNDAADLARRLTDWRERADHYKLATDPFCQMLRNYTWDKMAAQMVDIMKTM